MSTFQCECCGSVDNTGTSYQKHRRSSMFVWTYVESLKGKQLCYACGPTVWRGGKPIPKKDWHNRFFRDYLPLRQFICHDYRVVHKETMVAHTKLDFVLQPTHYAVTLTDYSVESYAEADYPRRKLIADLLSGVCELPIKDVGVYVVGEQPKAPIRPERKFSLLD